jgi:hypothetical protein
MAGTITGGLKAAQKNKESDPDFYKKIAYRSQIAWNHNGRKPRGFAYAKLHYSPDDPRHPATAGNVGGLKSKRKVSE